MRELKILVTGGAGFIGSHLVDELISKGVSVIVIDNLSSGKKENLNPKAVHVNIDLSTMNINKFHWELYPMKFFKNVDTVFHLAATPQVQYSIENPTDNNNVDGYLDLELSVAAPSFCSSGIKYYGHFKMGSEKNLQETRKIRGRQRTFPVITHGCKICLSRLHSCSLCTYANDSGKCYVWRISYIYN